MTSSPGDFRFGTVIVGGGAAGTLVAIRLLKDEDHTGPVAIVEPDEVLARGAAYGTGRAEHLLNVVAGRMSALAEQPGHFVQFLAQDGAGDAEGLGDSFASRRDYGRYLRHTLESLPRSPVHLRERVVDIERADGGFRLHLASGAGVLARHVVLAVGNAPRPLPDYLLHPGMRLAEAWDYDAIQGIEADATVCILGSGLSMVDAALSLAAADHRGPIHVLSRHGLMPLPHARTGPQHGAGVDDLLPLGVRDRWRVLRRRVADAVGGGEPWQWSFDRLRHHGQALWQSLDDGQRRRFLRHAVRYWDIHRHRIAPEADAVLQALRQSGRLQLHRARLDLAAPGPRCVHLGARGQDGRRLQLDVDHVVNATGVELRVQAMGNPLLEQLLGEGLATAGSHGIGLCSDGAGRVVDAQGLAQDGLRVIGSLRIGEAWESLAVPELRSQAAVIAGAWTASAPAPAPVPGA